MTTETTGVSTRLILSVKTEYIGWKRMILFELLEQGYIATIKTTTLIAGKSEERAVHQVLKTVSLKLQTSIPADCCDTLTSLFHHLDSKFANESQKELRDQYYATKMVGIRPHDFIHSLDIARAALINAKGIVSPDEQLKTIVSNCHQAFYATWIRDQLILYQDMEITQAIVDKVTASMIWFYVHSNEELRSQYEGRKYSANSAQAKRKPRPKCNHCHKVGHLEENCYGLHPELRPNPEIKEVDAYFDSCANKHFFTDPPADSVPVTATVLTADGSSIRILSKGKIKIGDIWIEKICFLNLLKLSEDILEFGDCNRTTHRVTLQEM